MQKNKFMLIIILCGVFFSFNAAAQEKPPTEEQFFEIIRSQGIAKAVEVFQKARQVNPDTVIFRERALNRIGYQVLGDGKVEEAIEIFKLNVIAYPDAFNTYDSLGEAYMLHGDTDLAVKNYKKSVKLNPERDTGSWCRFKAGGFP